MTILFNQGIYKKSVSTRDRIKRRQKWRNYPSMPQRETIQKIFKNGRETDIQGGEKRGINGVAGETHQRIA